MKRRPVRLFAARLYAALLLAALLLSACGRRAQTPPGGASQQGASTYPLPLPPEALPAGAEALAEGAREAAFPASDAARIHFSNGGAETSGAGVSASGAVATIERAGAYLVTGETQNGRLVVDAGAEDEVHIALSGARLRCENGPALLVKGAGRVLLTVMDGTENALSDGGSYGQDGDKANACLFSEAALTVRGAGALTVTGLYKHGIAVKGDLLLVDAALTVTAADDGIRGRDGVLCFGAALTVSSGGDAIASSKAQGAWQGQIVLADARCVLTAQGDGAQAETALHAARCELTITAGGGAGAALEKGSAKGLKSGGALVLTGGSVRVSSADDALHAGGSLSFSETAATLASGDDALHADGALSVFSGTIAVETCNEGLEGRCVELLGGTLRIRALNDGINAAVSGDSGAADGAVYIRVAGGTVFIDAAGDGVDSNGDLFFTGGVTLICGPTDNQNGALDYDGAARVSGGVLVALGWKGEAKALDAASPQGFLAISVPMRAAGERLTLCDASGRVLASCVPEKAYESMVISAPGMRAGDAVTLYAGGGAAGDGLVMTEGRLEGGVKLGAYSLSGARP